MMAEGRRLDAVVGESLDQPWLECAEVLLHGRPVEVVDPTTEDAAIRVFDGGRWE